MIQYFQRDKLDEQFDELFKDASLDFKMKLEADSLTNENLDNMDEDVILAEYHSEDEAPSRSEDAEEDEDHITKVCASNSMLSFMS